ncbi:MAG TPA: nucleotide exchange factor GrpE [Bacteroidales bacterium]|nr:nucleotide exchange factor GrpE [Bacteroidales bacterium]
MTRKVKNTKEEKNNQHKTEQKNNEKERKDNVNNKTKEANPNHQPEEEQIKNNHVEDNGTKEEADNVATEVNDMESKLADFELQVQELKDKYVRLSAEFDNYRKRTLKEKMELSKSAGEDILISLLPVVDDFDRAVKSVDEASDIVAIKEGVHLIYAKFKEFLNQKGVKEIDALHKEFDTDEHEALTKIPVPEEDLKGKVVDVIEKGYFLNEKVIRFSKVVVGE